MHVRRAPGGTPRRRRRGSQRGVCCWSPRCSSAGGSRGAGDLVVHLAALPALALGILRWRHARRFAAATLVPVLAARRAGAGRAAAAAAAAASVAHAPAARRGARRPAARGHRPAWLPMTLDVWGTVRALLALATFAAMWLLASTLPYATRVRLLQLAVRVAVLMALLGFAQAAAGAAFADCASTTTTIPIGAIGTFANRNHFASCWRCCCRGAGFRGAGAQRVGSRCMPRPGTRLPCVLLLASALSFSRAGFALTCRRADDCGRGAVLAQARCANAAPARRLLAVAAVAVLAVALLRLGRADAAAGAGPARRPALAVPALRHGMRQALPAVGQRAGQLPWVYAPFEPVSAMQQVYAERAHNDLLQIADRGRPARRLCCWQRSLRSCSSARREKFPLGASGAMPDHCLGMPWPSSRFRPAPAFVRRLPAAHAVRGDRVRIAVDLDPGRKPGRWH